MTEQQFNDYFEAIATNLKDIAHVAGEQERFATAEDLLNGLHSHFDHATFILGVQHEQGELRNLGVPNMYELHQCSFMALKKTALEDYEAMTLAWEASFQVGQKILAKMVKDYESLPGIMALLQLESVSFHKVGPLADGHVGFEFKFMLAKKAGCNYKYNADDWI